MRFELDGVPDAGRLARRETEERLKTDISLFSPSQFIDTGAIMTTVVGTGTSPGDVGVIGESQQADGIHGIGHSGAGVSGVSDQWLGVYGESLVADGVRGQGRKGAGVSGLSDQWLGVYGESQQVDGIRGQGHKGSGVSGLSDEWIGVYGESKSFEGVRGVSNSKDHGGVVGINNAAGTAIYGTSVGGIGVMGTSKDFEGVHAETSSNVTAALAAYQTNASSASAALFAKHVGGLTAGRFEGDVEVTGQINGGEKTTIKCFDVQLVGADCAEDFDIATPTAVAAGSVMVVDEQGRLLPCSQPYDRRVAGVISGAGRYKPGLVLDRAEQPGTRQPLALVGKVVCRATANEYPIAIGDLLTTSALPGHAMKVTDPALAFGAVIGKALQSLDAGEGEIAMLVALQ